MAVNNKKIGNRIRIYRQNKGISSQQFAEMSGIKKDHLLEVERGRVELTLYDIIKIANILNITPDVLLYNYINSSRAMIENKLDYNLSKLLEDAPRLKKNMANLLQGRDVYGNRI